MFKGPGESFNFCRHQFLLQELLRRVTLDIFTAKENCQREKKYLNNNLFKFFPFVTIRICCLHRSKKESKNNTKKQLTFQDVSNYNYTLQSRLK